MTAQKKLKKEVRERMDRFGEPYSVALRAILKERGHPGSSQREYRPQHNSRMTDEEVLLEYGEHLGLPKG